MYFLAAFCWRTKPRSTNENNENGKSDGGVWGDIFARGDLKWRLKIKEFISNLVIQWSWVILVVKCWSSLQPCLRTQVWRLNLFQLQTSEVFFSQKHWASNRFEVTHCDSRKVSFASVAILLHACVKQWKRNRTFKAGGDWEFYEAWGSRQNVWETISQHIPTKIGKGEVNNIVIL